MIGTIYLIPVGDYYYIGSTSKKYLCLRKWYHTDSYKTRDWNLYKKMKQLNIKIDDIELITLEKYECQNLKELHQLERLFIDIFYDPEYCLNMRMPYITLEEKKKRIFKYEKSEARKVYLLKNKEKRDEYQKNYRLKNKSLNS